MVCYTNYGLLLYKLGKKAEAEKIYELCLDIHPDEPTCLNNYAILLFEMGQYAKSEEISKKCLKIDPFN